ncbi:2-aminoethylphosphonate--pyruvate transaminase [Candidatus Gugararchaeum adminiculabundum]|nr:2-aminoethylphosphonate--pyruvate transaminase [Candidatus Gugararchaeum adminiculabundum]
MVLLTPGPVYLSDEIRVAQANEMISHRCKEFDELHMWIINNLKKNFNAEEAYVITGSGSLGVETIICNAVNKQETMLCLTNGDFGDRFAKVAGIYAGKVITETLPWNQGWNLERAKPKIDAAHAAGAKVFGMVYNETSTGVTNKAGEICKYAKSKGMLTVIDAVSAWAGIELDMKAMAIDFTTTGSQKAIAAPPGLAMIGVSADGVKKYSSQIPPTYYNNMNTMKKFMEKKQTPYTPAVSLFFGLKAALERMERDGGYSANVKRHAEAAQYAREQAQKLGLKLFAEDGFRSNTVLAIETDKYDLIFKTLRDKYNIHIGGGQGQLKGKVIRPCHIGNFKKQDLDLLFAALREILQQ